MLQHLRTDLEKEGHGPAGLLELFLDASGEASRALGGTNPCLKDKHGERVGCKVGCTCAWYASCFTKFDTNYMDEGVQRRAPLGKNIGVCGPSIWILVLCSVSILVVLALIVFYIRACLLEWYATTSAQEIEDQLERMAMEKINGT